MGGHIVHVAAFMPAHQGKRPARRTIALGSPKVSSFWLEKQWFDPTNAGLFLDGDFQFYLYQTLPDFTAIFLQTARHAQTRLVVSTGKPREGYVAFVQDGEGYQVEIHGSGGYAQWNQLVQVYTFFGVLGRPKITDYGFEMDRQGQRLSLQRGKSLLFPFMTV